MDIFLAQAITTEPDSYKFENDMLSKRNILGHYTIVRNKELTKRFIENYPEAYKEWQAHHALSKLKDYNHGKDTGIEPKNVKELAKILSSTV